MNLDILILDFARKATAAIHSWASWVYDALELPRYGGYLSNRRKRFSSLLGLTFGAALSQPGFALSGFSKTRAKPIPRYEVPPPDD